MRGKYKYTPLLVLTIIFLFAIVNSGSFRNAIAHDTTGDGTRGIESKVDDTVRLFQIIDWRLRKIENLSFLFFSVFCLLISLTIFWVALKYLPGLCRSHREYLVSGLMFLLIIGILSVRPYSIFYRLNGVFKEYVYTKEKMHLNQRLAREEMSLNEKCPLSQEGGACMVVGNGNLILPGKFRKADSPEAANIIIFHSSDVKPLMNVLAKGSSYLNNLRQEKVLIITTLTISALKANKKDDLFNEYLENYKRTGDIFNGDGRKFYYIDEIDFDVPADASGVILSVKRNIVFQKVKNYALAYLTRTGFDLTNLTTYSAILRWINFTMPDYFDGTFEELLKTAKREYSLKYLPNIIEISPSFIKAYPPNLRYFAKEKFEYLPLIKVLRLSKNVFISSLNRR